MYIGESEKIGASYFIAVVQFEDGETNEHKFTNYSYENVFEAIVEHYKDQENEKSVLRIIIETRNTTAR